MSNRQYHEDELQQLVQKATTIPSMDASAHQRIKHKLLLAFSESQATKGEFAYREKRNVFINQLMVKPMVSIIVAIVLIFTGVGTAVAADQSKPGDALYGVDQALEQTRLHFTFSDTAKAKVMVKIAEEREQEHELAQQENGQSEDTQAAEDNANRALQNALETISRVKEKHEEEGREQASESLSEVEEKLTELRQRFEERQQEELKVRLKNTVGETELKVKIQNGQAKLELRVGENTYKYTLETTDMNEIIASIQQRTGLSSEDINTLLNIEVEESDDESGDEDTNANANANSESSSERDGDDEENDDTVNGNANLNVNDDSSDDAADEEADDDSPDDDEDDDTSDDQPTNSDDSEDNS